MKELSACTILLVDDTETNIDVLVAALKDDYKLWAALDGESALEYALAHHPDLVLLDIMMPGMDGYEVCRRLRYDPATRDIPIVFLTAMDETEHKTAGFEAGAVDYITKPFEILEVKARVKTHLLLKLALEEHRRNEDKFRYLSEHDDLTGLHNTRYLYQALENHLQAAKARGRPVAVIFMDIDKFKRTVDAHGHLNGSRVIAEVAATIQAGLAEPAFGVAYAGDEFVIVLPGLTKAQGVARAEDIRRRIAETEYLREKNLSIRLSASFGVAAYPEDAAEIDDLLGRADQALFQVKARGRNAVAAWEAGGLTALTLGHGAL